MIEIYPYREKEFYEKRRTTDILSAAAWRTTEYSRPSEVIPNFCNRILENA